MHPSKSSGDKVVAKDEVVSLGELGRRIKAGSVDHGAPSAVDGLRSAPPIPRGGRFFSSSHFPKRRKKRGEKLPLMAGKGSQPGPYLPKDSLVHNHFPDSRVYNALVRSVEEGISEGVLPAMIAQGSSGSYFAKDAGGRVVAVFKPKDEEPYGHLNPKWLKWAHRLCCPCCFGRACLPPNQGYASEAGAWLVDAALGLGLVPETRVVRLAAASFNYSPEQKTRARLRQRFHTRFPDAARRLHINTGLPYKVGSLQTFVRGYQSAGSWLRDFGCLEDLPKATQKEFLLRFQRLVCLDYIIRNTDRSTDNWLVKWEGGEAGPRGRRKKRGLGRAGSGGSASAASVASSTASEATSSAGEPLPDVVPDESAPRLHLAAIDNGLAFPFKHPDEWRAYPFHWAGLPEAQLPFAEETAALLLPKLEDTVWVGALCDALRRLFRQDAGSDPVLVEGQLAVLRGQMFNLKGALGSRQSPAHLVRLPPQLMVQRRAGKGGGREAGKGGQLGPAEPKDPTTKVSEPPSWEDVYAQRVPTTSPLFSAF